jgi:hypothetical protein
MQPQITYGKFLTRRTQRIETLNQKLGPRWVNPSKKKANMFLSKFKNSTIKDLSKTEC